jgi:tetratricopeptide (TPR) repeat protein
MEKGNLEAAVLEYRNAVQKDAMFAPARLKLAEAYLRQGNGAGALAESVRAADLLPNDVEAQMKAGSLLYAAGRPQDALGRADKILAMDPGNANASVLRAGCLARAGDLDGAIAQMQQAIGLGVTADRLTTLGALLRAKGKLPEAEAAFRKAVDTDSKSVAARVALGEFLASTTRASEAEVAFRAALAIDGGHVDANRAIAAFFIASNRAPEAEPYFKKAADASPDPAVALSLADYYITVGRTADAVAALEKLSATPRGWGAARSRVAALRYVEGKKDEAHRTIDEVIAKQPASSEARVVRGRFLLAEGKAVQALAEAQLAVKADPRNADAHFLLGSVHWANRDFKGAAASFNEALRLNPRATAVQVQLAALQLGRGESEDAARLAEQALQGDPRNLDAKLLLARSLLVSGALDRAAEVTRQLVVEFPKSGRAQAQAGLEALRRGDRAAGRTFMENALAIDPELLDPLKGLVALDLADKRGDRARSRIEARLQKAPKDGAVLVLAARTWAATGDSTKAAEFLHRAIEADTRSFEAYGLLGQLYMAQNRLDEALAQYDRQAAQQPGASGPQTAAAMILEAQGKPDEARKRYERIVELDPRAAVASNNLAWMYASRGEHLDRALQLAQAAVAEEPENPAVNDTLAFVYLKKQLPALAVPPLRLAVGREPGNPTYQFHLGMALAQSGNRAEARKALEQALKLSPNFDGADDARKLLNTLG